jgi:hypothetical protein
MLLCETGAEVASEFNPYELTTTFKHYMLGTDWTFGKSVKLFKILVSKTYETGENFVWS